MELEKAIKLCEPVIEGAKKNKVISERDILLLKRRSNATGHDLWVYDEETENVEVTPSQAEKGYEWLRNLLYAPSGRERNSHPFGYREIEALNGENHGFTFDGFHDVGNHYFSHFTPIYSFFSDKGYFQYYVGRDGIEIIG